MVRRVSDRVNLMKYKAHYIAIGRVPLKVNLLLALIRAVQMVHYMRQLTRPEAVVIGLSMSAEDVANHRLVI